MKTNLKNKGNMVYQMVFKKNKINVFWIIFLSIIGALLNAYAGYSLSYVLETGVTTIETIYRCLFVAAVYIIAIFSLYIQEITYKKFIQKINTQLRNQISTNISNMPYSKFFQKETGNYMSWFTNDIDKIDELMIESFFDIVINFSLSLFSIIAIGYLNIYLILLNIFLLIIMSAVPGLTGKYLQKKTEKFNTAQEVNTEEYKEQIMGYTVYNTLKAFKVFIEKISGISKKFEKEKLEYECASLKVYYSNFALSFMVQIITFGVAVILVNKGQLVIGGLLSIISLAQTFNSSLFKTISSVVQFKSAKPIAQKFEENINENVILKNNATENINSIKLENISFGYDDKKIIDKFNLTINKSGKYVLFGESGSGKSTIAKIISGLIENFDGKYKINDKIITNEDMSSIYNNILYIDQNPYLFNESVYDNICLGQKYSNEEIENILKICCLDSFIAQQNNGINTIITENGKNLSGGQKQRIALARALIRKMPIIILDEPTSALDKENAFKIEEYLLQNQDLTVIIISHNFNKTLEKYVDGIIDMENLKVKI